MNLDKFFAPFPVLETERLRLRELLLSDAEALFEVFGDAQAMYYYNPTTPHQKIEETEQVIRDLETYAASRDSIRWAITLKNGDNRALGTVGFYSFDHAAKACELGYELHRAQWRKGIMSEALRCLLDYAFYEVGLNRVQAGTDDDNPPSQALLRKMGFKHEGCLRQKLFYKGKYWDEHWFGLLKSDYEQAP